MKKTIILALLLLFSFFTASCVSAQEAAEQSVEPPTISEAVKVISGQDSKIKVSGLSRPGKITLIYLNGNYAGIANISQEYPSYNLFYFELPLLFNQKIWEVSAIAKDGKSLLMSAPATTNSIGTIELSTSIPKKEAAEKIFSPVKKEEIKKPLTESQPPTISIKQLTFNDYDQTISGMVKNASLVKIFIDNQLVDVVELAGAGATSFYYNLTDSLKRGTHSVYAIAVNKLGKEGLTSNILSFTKNEPKITAESATEENDSLATSSTATSNTPTIKQAATNDKTGHEKKINLNLVIFIIFLAGIVLWMFIVNRELIKEARQDKKTEENNKLDD